MTMVLRTSPRGPATAAADVRLYAMALRERRTARPYARLRSQHLADEHGPARHRSTDRTTSAGCASARADGRPRSLRGPRNLRRVRGQAQLAAAPNGLRY